MDFVSNTQAEQKEMLKAIGVQSIDDLFRDIPRQIFLSRELNLGHGLSEQETRAKLYTLSKKNANALDYSFFLGAGVYNHFVPAIVWALASRGEFLTAYTPYQPEVSQGMLQSIFEWQTMICELTGMEAANASTYDGGEATAEAVLMSKNIAGRKKILVSVGVNPQYRAVARTYADANDLEFVEVAQKNGMTSIDDLKKKIDDKTAGVILQSPNFFGCIESLKEIGEVVHKNGAVFSVVVAEGISLGLLKSPGELGADIVVGDAQSFGIPMSFGGPHAGFVATKMGLVRHLPGRIVGLSEDSRGNKGFIMTLQAREQHIRREKASSSLCTNQALCALAATIYLSLAGKTGLKALAEANHSRTAYLYEKLSEIKGMQLPFEPRFFNEFVVKIPNAKKVQEKLLSKNIVFGYNLESDFPGLKDHVLVAVTESNSDEQVESLLSALKEELK